MSTSRLFRAVRCLKALPVVLLALLMLPAVGGATAPHPTVDTTTHELKDSVTNTALQLRGVNFTGSEYMCFDDTANETFDIPATTTTINRMKAWKINVVRLPINEDCWVGANGYPTTDPSDPPVMTPQKYQGDLSRWVNTLVANNIAVQVNMHFYAPGTDPSTDQSFMADRDHARTFWTQVANTWKANPAVIFDLVNEPQAQTSGDPGASPAAWDCWKNGDPSCTAAFGAWGNAGVAGMDDLIASVRSTGATNPIVADGLRFGNDLTGWLTHKPTDPTGQLIAGFHNYGDFAGCTGLTCYTTQVEPVNTQVPVIAGEFGDFDCTAAYPNTFMSWADTQPHKVSYIAWAWTNGDCADEPALLTNLNGTPSTYGRAVCTHYRTLAGFSDCAAGSPPTLARTAKVSSKKASAQRASRKR